MMASLSGLLRSSQRREAGAGAKPSNSCRIDSLRIVESIDLRQPQKWVVVCAP